jgi:hypothetical protein
VALVRIESDGGGPEVGRAASLPCQINVRWINGRVEAVKLMDDADDHLEASGLLHAGKVKSEGDRERSGGVNGRECAGLGDVYQHGGVSGWMVQRILPAFLFAKTIFLRSKSISFAYR